MALICASCLLCSLISAVPHAHPVPGSDLSSNFSPLLFPFYFIACPLFLLSYQNKGLTTPEQQIIKLQQNLHGIELSNKKCLYLFWFWALSSGKDCTWICVFLVIPFPVSGELPALLTIPTLLFSLFLPVHCTAFSECCDSSALWWGGVEHFIAKNKVVLGFLS